MSGNRGHDAKDAIRLDYSRLMGFGAMAGMNVDNAQNADALTRSHSKVGEVPPAQPAAMSRLHSKNIGTET